ncbi:uncharacterized protein LOC115319802 [Ixodes scapularis]|uniref:uncharacterized protein LOC115319802 n=1 Tax=Ixodes scapularis TaxID=6945 RepID=UPI001A9E63E8|nr:uncharacterized protein LOC115319802 [Ixodes scapularis]
MVLLHALVGALWVSIVSTQDNSIPGTEDNSIPGNCDAAENVVLEDRLQRALDQLPRNFVATNTGQIQLIPKIFFLGNTIVEGLMHLRPDRPYRTFCRGQDRVTLFSIRSTRPIRIAIPWRLCSGLNGTIHGHAVHLRYKGEMITRNAGGGTSTSRIEALTPVLTENFFVGMSGAGGGVDLLVSVLAHILYGPVRLYWVEVMTANVLDALGEALGKLA